MMVGLNISLLTKEVMIAVSNANEFPSTSSIWSPSILLRDKPRWYAISYTKYIQVTLPFYYSQDGFSDILYGRCYIACYYEQLRPLGLAYPGLYHEPSDLKYVTRDDRMKAEINEKYTKIRELCRERCETSDEFSTRFAYTRYSYQSASISGTGNQTAFHLDNSHNFYLHRTEYPVLVLIFRPQQSIFNLLILLGSILGIWYGLSMNILYLAVDNSPESSLTLEELISLERSLQKNLSQLNHLEDVFAKNRRRSRFPKISNVTSLM